MATLSVQQIARTGIVPSYAAADVAGDLVPWSADTFLHVKNGGAGSITVTVASQYSIAPIGTVAQDLTVSIDAGAEKMIGPFYEAAYKNADGNVEISYSDAASVTVAALKV